MQQRRSSSTSNQNSRQPPPAATNLTWDLILKRMANLTNLIWDFIQKRMTNIFVFLLYGVKECDLCLCILNKPMLSLIWKYRKQLLIQKVSPTNNTKGSPHKKNLLIWDNWPKLVKSPPDFIRFVTCTANLPEFFRQKGVKYTIIHWFVKVWDHPTPPTHICFCF